MLKCRHQKLNVRATGTFCWYMVAFLFTIGKAASMVLLGDRRHGSDSRYFTVEDVLPPLQAFPAASANDALPYRQRSKVTKKPLPIVYTNDPKQVSQWLCQHIPSSGGLLGFDVESVPNAPWVRRKASFQGPATVQIATTDASLVIHMIRRNGRPSRACAPIIEAVLSDASIVKAGAGIDHDLLELYDTWEGLKAESRLELGGIGSDQSVHSSMGLQRLTRSVLQVDLPKSKRLAMSDWSQVPLTDMQLRYSARDAWAGAAIVDELARRDPDTFGSAALTEQLQDQRSLQDLYRRREARKEAKFRMTELLAPYVEQPRARSRGKMDPRAAMRLAHSPSERIPPPLRARVSRLKKVLRDTSHEGHMVFDVAKLGITIHQ